MILLEENIEFWLIFSKRLWYIVRHRKSIRKTPKNFSKISFTEYLHADKYERCLETRFPEKKIDHSY